MYDLIYSDNTMTIIIEVFKKYPTKSKINDIKRLYKSFGFYGSFTLKG